MKKIITLTIALFLSILASAHDSNRSAGTVKKSNKLMLTAPFSIYPATAYVGQTLQVSFTSNGTLFGTSTSCLHLDSTNIVLANSTYPGVSVHAYHYYLTDTMHMIAYFHIPNTLPAGSYDVEIGTSCKLTLSSGFTINANLPQNDFYANYSPSPQLGATLQVTFTDPQSRFFNASTNCLSTDSTNILFIHNPTGLTYKPASHVAHFVSTEKFQFLLPQNAPVGQYDIVAGQGSQCPLWCYNCMYIMPTPILSNEMSPAYGMPGQTKLITFTDGNNLFSCMALDTSNILFQQNVPYFGPSFHANSYTVVSSNTMQANINIPANASPGLYNVTTGTSACAKSCTNCFAITTTNSLADLVLYYTIDPVNVRPSHGVGHQFQVVNYGTTTVKPSLVVTLDPNCNAGGLYSNPPYDSLVNNKFYYSLDSLSTGEMTSIWLSSATSSTVTIGTTLTNYATVYPVSTDFNPTNNTDTIQQLIQNSYDPNAKYVFPNGPITPAFVSAQTPLDYIVEFQNTGNAPAIDIVVVDTLSNFLDLSTFRLTSSSHYCSYNLSAGGILTVTYHNIMLPDSTSNEQQSHGFFRYEIAPKTSMNLGDVIYNTANIYFDNNTAVVTNTTATMIATMSVKNNIISNAYVIYPNPSSGLLRIMGPELEGGTVLIADASGREVLSIPYNYFVNAESLSAGAYFVYLKSKTGEIISVNKLIKK